MKTLKTFATIVAMLMCCITTSAQTLVDGIWYNFNSDGTAEVTRNGKYTGDVTIPATVTYEDKTYDVTSIGGNAFYSCSALTSITIPNSITSIGDQAFEYCTNLQSVAIPSNVKTIGYRSFENCHSLQTVNLSEGLISIGVCAFQYCVKLQSIVIPGSVTNVSNYAFRDCSKLESVTFCATTAPVVTDAVFKGISSTAILRYPAGSDYSGWSSYFASTKTFSTTIGGSCGANVDWTLADGVLTISGSGDMTDFSWSALGPWDKHKNNIQTVVIENSVTSIGSYAFASCSNLTSITIPNSVTSIGSSAFDGCSKLTEVHITSIENWCNINFGNYSNANPLYNGGNLYLNGDLVTEITIPSSVTQVKNYAFYYYGMKVTLQSTTPPALASTSAFNSDCCFVVPATAYDDYCSAPYWADMKNRITKDNMNIKNVALTANSNRSALETEIGEANLRYVTDLTISGTINSYDFMVMRNKMTMLRNLDLSEATIVANKYEHYTGYCTEDNKFPGYGLYNCKLNTLILPENIENIGYYAIGSNTQLRMLEMQKGITTIGNYAFYSCSKLAHVDIPNSVTSIGSYAFQECLNLKSVEIQKGLVTIGNGCFASCRSLSSIMLSPSITSIGSSAFSSCYSLSEVHLPSSLRSVGDNAFNNCSKLKDVYVYVVEPIKIGQNTFTRNGNNFTSTLHAPKTSYWDYYYNTQWSQFLYFAEFEGTYDNFYLEGDKVLDNETGSIDGENGKAPDAELGNNSGIIVGGDVNQDLGDVDVEHDGENGGSIIVEGEGQVTFENLTFHIKVKGGRWYFFCFPFDVRKGDVKCENGADWVFRYYDGEERAQNGKGGWKNVTSEGNGNFLKAATGYIFQCSKDDVLTLSAKNDRIKQEKKYIELVEHVTENMQDASWNFVGNPYLSYYEITQEDYSAPITVWDGEKYIAIRPGDDSYVLAPFEAFFVQKPNGTNTVSYNPENQMTYNQAQNSGSNARVAGMSNNTQRMLINITLNNGAKSDRTRVVFNDNANIAYELECDASKFSTEGAIQIYTMNADNAMYAINERPMAQGCVKVGYSVPAQGKYTIEAPRQDIGVLLMDNVTGEVHDLTKGGYEFASEAGTFNNRFMLIAKGDATGIIETENGKLKTENSNNASTLYNIKGQKVKTMEQGEIYIKNNVKVTKN